MKTIPETAPRRSSKSSVSSDKESIPLSSSSDAKKKLLKVWNTVDNQQNAPSSSAACKIFRVKGLLFGGNSEDIKMLEDGED